MFERFHELPQSEITPTTVVDTVLSLKPEELVPFTQSVSILLESEQLPAHDLVHQFINKVEKIDDIDQQSLILSALLLLEGRQTFYHGTEEFLSDLKKNHDENVTFSLPFQRFISERLRMSYDFRSKKIYENSEEAKKVLDLIRVNKDFFHDVLGIQEHFTRTISPTMPLNATWNPDLTQKFRLRNAAGLWYIYAHNLRDLYVESMKQHMSSEWTGFHRFEHEPWDYINTKVRKDGKLVDVGSSIGISALEIAHGLKMNGTIVLVDYYNPFRQSTSLRVTDYKSTEGKFIPINEAIARMEQLRGDRLVVTLYGIDIGKPLSPEVSTYVDGAAFVHVANTLPYIPLDNMYQAMYNLLSITSPQQGVLRTYNDDTLPLAHLIRSLTLKRDGDKIVVFRELLRGTSV